MLSTWTEVFPEGRGGFFWLVVGCILIGLVALLDVRTGAELAFSLFYLIPVMIVTWFAGKRAGVAVSVIAGVAWYLADTLAGQIYSQPMIGYWNAGIRFGFFLVVALLLPALKELEREKELSLIDDLTGTSNRRHFVEAAQAELVRNRQTQQPLSVAYIDIDGFKSINDRHGHAVGDKLLRAMVARTRNHLRGRDMIARVGGDEFVLLLPETDGEAARYITRGIQSAIDSEMRHHNWAVKFSIGVATYTKGTVNAEDLMAFADNLMYASKRGGSNSIEHAVYPAHEDRSSIQTA